jgi:hypothetical protein
MKTVEDLFDLAEEIQAEFYKRTKGTELSLEKAVELAASYASNRHLNRTGRHGTQICVSD